jgi:hypothetical protein
MIFIIKQKETQNYYIYIKDGLEKALITLVEILTLL